MISNKHAAPEPGATGRRRGSRRRQVAAALVLTPAAVLGGLAVTATGAEAATASPTVAYVLEAADHQVVSVAADGTVSPIITGLGAPTDMSIDATGNLYVADGTSVKIFNPDGTPGRISYFYSFQIKAIAATRNGQFYLASATDVIGGGGASFDQGIAGVKDLAVSGDGSLYVATGSDVNGLIKVAPDGTASNLDVTTTPTLTRVSFPTAVATAPGSRDVWVSDANRNISPTAGRVLQLSGSTPENVYPGSPAITPVIAVDGAGGVISWDGSHGRLVNTGPTGQQTVMANGIFQPTAIAVAPVSLIAGRTPYKVSGSLENADWSSADLTNGSRFSWPGDKGYTSLGSPTPNHPEFVTYDFGSRRSLTSAVLYPRTQDPTDPVGTTGAGFPATVQFLVSDDAVTYRSVAAFTAQSADDGNSRTYLLPAGTTGRYLQVAAPLLGRAASGDGSYRFQLSELQVYGSAVAPSTITGDAREAAANAPYSFSYATDANPAATFTVASGALPNGLSLSAAGTISGTPTTAGTFAFTVAARNTTGVITKAQSITVTTPAATTGTPGNGSVGSTYNWSFGISGSPAPKVTVTSGALPAGLTLNTGTGAITGMPTQAGQATFQVTAASTAANTTTRTVAMTIDPGASGQLANATPPPSVQPGAWENSQSMRIFTERQNLLLNDAVTVGGTTIPAGAKVNVYYVHADPVGSANVLTRYYGVAAFGERVLGVATTGADLQATTALLGNPGTTYSTSPDQGLESTDHVTVSPAQDVVTLDLSVYNTSDAVRVITLAP
jgi:Putative Ig domain